MTLAEIRQLARDRGLVPKRMRKAELIHRLQGQEGNIPCYNTHSSMTCGQDHCLWRPNCQ